MPGQRNTVIPRPEAHIDKLFMYTDLYTPVQESG